MTPERLEPSVTQQVKFDAICVQFEQAWRGGERPSIESFLAGAPEAERPLLLPQLLLLELEYLEEGGSKARLEDYLARFPQEPTVVRRAFEEHATALAAVREDVKPERTVDQPLISERPGSQIGRYKLLEQIGEGGMGVVYMAEQQRPVRRKVALKIIKPGMDTKQVVARFEAERQALAMMDHPNIARVLDAGSTDSGRPYFVMELVRGTTITDYCDANKLETNERLKLFKSVCQAVQHAHTKGVIHRDLKPTNVLVTLHDGVPVPKIIDFGVSKAMGGQLTEKTMFTAFAQMVGTPLYMSPEQAEMSGLDIDTRSDIYSLGVLLYELLTGVTPFDRKRLHTAAFDELRRIIREEEPEKPSTRVSSLGESNATVSAQRSTDPAKLKQSLRGELDWIVMKSLEKDRNRRYETANALVAEVDRYLAGEPVNACPPSATYRLRKFANRYRAQVTVAAGFTALLMASSIVAWWLYADARQARDEVAAVNETLTSERDRALDAERSVRIQRDRAESEKRRADRQADELKTRLYDYNLLKADAAYRQDDTARASDLLLDCLEEQRGWEWHHLRQLLGGSVEPQLDVAAQTLAVSPSDTLLAVGDLEGGIRLLSRTDGRLIWKQDTGNRFVLGTSFSPDGDYVAVTHANKNPYATGTVDPSFHGGIQLRATATGETVWEENLKQGIFAEVQFSPDGQRYVVWGGSSLSHLWLQLRETKTGKKIWTSPLRGLPISMKFSPDGERLFLNQWSRPYVNTPSTLDCWNVADHSSIWSVSRKASSAVAITQDGSRLVTGGANHSIQVWDAASGKQLEEVFGGLSDFAGSIELSRNDATLVSRCSAGITIWDWQNRTPVRTIREGTTTNFPPILVSSNGEYLVTLDSIPGSRIRVLAVDPPPPVLTLRGHEGWVRGVAFTPDGKQVLATGFDGTLRRWDTTSGQEVETRVIGDGDAKGRDGRPKQSLTAVAVSPSGNQFATGSEEAVYLWNAETGELEQRWPNMRVRSLQFSPDGQRLLVGNYIGGQGVKLLDVANPGEIKELATPPIHGADFAADGLRVLFIQQGDGAILLWDPESGADPQTLRPANQDWGQWLVRVPASNLVAGGLGDEIELWDVERRQHVMTLRVPQVECLAVNRDGSRLFSGDRLGEVRVWNLISGEQLLRFQAHEALDARWWGIRGVMSMTLSPDGKTLATTGADGLVKLWETTRPSPAVVKRRSIVREATTAVDQQFEQTSSRRAVFEALSNDPNLDPSTLKVALDIAHTRGEYIDSRRATLLEAIETAAGIDFDEPEAASTVPAYRWIGNAYHLTIPQALPLEQMVNLLRADDSEPHSHYLASLRAMANARLGRWQQADADFERALRGAPHHSDFWHWYAYRYAFLLVHRQRWDRYRQLCQEAISDLGDDKSSSKQEQVARMCLFSGDNRSDLEYLSQLADQAHERGHPYPPRQAKSALTKAIATLRRGEFKSAVEQLTTAGEAYDGIDQERPVVLYLYLAIAHAQLADKQEAQEALQTADHRIAKSPRTTSNYYMWFEWMEQQTVRREVTTLFESLD